MCAALLLLLTCGAVLQAQPRCDIRHYSFSDGLSQSVVQRLVQSADGRLWFCTWDGLNSYDGTTFVSYNMASPGGKALSTNRIIDIQPGICPGPYIIVSILHQTPDVVVAETGAVVREMPEYPEAGPVIPVQPVLCPEPHKSSAVLDDCGDRVL